MLQHILEPLCRATESILEPVSWWDQDHLLIDVDDDGKRFVVEPASLHPSNGHHENIVEHKGQTWWASSNYNHTHYKILQRIPERHRKGSKWVLGGTDFSVIVLHHGYTLDRLVFQSEEAELLYHNLLKRFVSQNVSAKIAAEFKVNGKVPDLPRDYIKHPQLPLSDYQEAALMTTLGQECSCLFMDPGTGKTQIAIYRINIEGFRKKDGFYRALIICPQAVRSNWEREFQRFCTYPGKTSIIKGDSNRRVKALIDGVRPESDCIWGASIISTDLVFNMYDKLRKVEWDLVVLDESHHIKNPSSQRFRAAKLFHNHSSARMCLTGTPYANSIMDLFSQFEFLGPGMSGFMTFQNFRKFHGKYRPLTNGSPVQKLIGIKSLPLIQERLARVAFLLTEKEVGLKLPDKIYNIYEVEMTPKQRAIYKNVANDIIAEIECHLDDATVSVEHILTKLMRLAQITSGFVKTDSVMNPITAEVTPGSVVQIDEVNPKVEGVLEILAEESDPNGKTILWCHFIEDARVMSAGLAAAGIDHVGYHAVTDPRYRKPNVVDAAERFNMESDCKVLIANPASGGEGLNLLGYDKEHPDKISTYVNHCIYVSCDWSMIKRVQSEKRAHRRDARSPSVRITDLMVSGTIDEEIRARVLAKKQKAMLVQDIREILEKIV